MPEDFSMLDPDSVLSADPEEPLVENTDDLDADAGGTDNEDVSHEDTDAADKPKGDDVEGKEGDDKSDDKSDDKEGDKEGKGRKGDDDIDLRKTSKEIYNALTKFRDASPENAPLAKVLRQAIGHDLAYQESYKTPQEARIARAQMDALGGPEGIASTQEVLADIEATDAMLDSSDAKVLDKFGEKHKAGIVGLAPHYLEKLKGWDEKAYKTAILPHLVDNLASAGFEGVLSALIDAVKDEGSPDVKTIKQIVGNLQSWFGNQKQQADGVRNSLTNPKSAALDDREKKLNERDEQAFHGEWKQSVREHSSTAIWKEMQPYVKNFNDNQKRDFAQGVIDEIQRRLNADKVYNKQKDALLNSKTRSKERIVAFQNAKLDSVVAEAAKTIFANRYGGKAPVKSAAADKSGKGAGKGSDAPATGLGSMNSPIFVKDKPARNDRDATKDPEALYEIAGKAFMKAGPYKGKWVTWRAPKK
jgi:hypothetical protein